MFAGCGVVGARPWWLPAEKAARYTSTMQIFVNMVSGKVLTLEVEGNHTVEEVHDMIESAEGVPRLL